MLEFAIDLELDRDEVVAGIDSVCLKRIKFRAGWTNMCVLKFLKLVVVDVDVGWAEWDFFKRTNG